MRPDLRLRLLLANVEPEPNSGCWIWVGLFANGRNQGYGRVYRTYAHRAIFKLLRGPIGPGLTLDHLCRMRWCVNPDHLAPVTNKENILRGMGFGAINARKTHCPRGHA